MSVNTSSFPSELGISKGTILGKSYKVEDFLREGAFGVTVKCLNIQTNKTLAIKMKKNNSESVRQAKKELFILDKLRCLDPDSCNIIKCNGFFVDRERLCLKFELLDQSLAEYMEDRNNQGLHISELRPIVYQMANALYHLNSIGIIHGDLKPDNVMVVDRRMSPITVKVIDFGRACPVSAAIPGNCVQDIWYAAPEALLDAPFNQAIDMWSLGLIAAELAIGWPLYPGDMEYDVLSFMVQTQGQPPDCVLDQAFGTDNFFIPENSSDRRWRFKCEEEFHHETRYQAQDTRHIKLKRLDDLESLMETKTGHQSGQDLLVSLIKQMLHLDANQRLTPLEALQDPFFNPNLLQSDEN